MKMKRLLVFGKAPEWLGYGEEDVILVDAQAAEKLSAAARCRTWGDFASLLGYPFDRMLAVWGARMREANEDTPPTAESPLRFAAVWGVWDIGDLVEDPRAAAAAALPRGVDWENHPALAETIQFSDDTMTTEGCALVSDSAAGFDLLSCVLNDEGFDGFEIKQDDAFVADTFSWLRPG